MKITLIIDKKFKIYYLLKHFHKQVRITLIKNSLLVLFESRYCFVYVYSKSKPYTNEN